MSRRRLPLWLKLFFFATFMLAPTVGVLVISLRNSTNFLADLSINSEVEGALKSNLDAMRDLKRHTSTENLDALEQRFNRHLETYQAYSALKDVKGTLLQEFYKHALIVGVVALLVSLIGASFLARNILAIFNEFAAKLCDRERQQGMMSSLENWQEVSKSVIHELKSSLTPIKLLTSRPSVELSSEDRDARQVVTTEISKMEALIDELTGFARLPKPRLNEINLVSSLEYVATNFLIDGLSVRLSPNESNLSQHIVRHDPGMIHRLLFNLMKNAREANVGAVVVTIGGEVIENLVKLHIRDDGLGIDPAKLSAIFEPGVSQKPKVPHLANRSSLPTNLGIGLAICKKIALDHGGDLIAEPSDMGAHFVLTLPISKFSEN